MPAEFWVIVVIVLAIVVGIAVESHTSRWW